MRLALLVRGGCTSAREMIFCVAVQFPTSNLATLPAMAVFSNTVEVK